MVRKSIFYKGVEYPVIEIARNLIDSEWANSDTSFISDYSTDINFIIADIELWYAIEEDYENDKSTAVEIDNSIYYYCDSGFVASKPSEKEVIDYFKELDEN